MTDSPRPAHIPVALGVVVLGSDPDTYHVTHYSEQAELSSEVCFRAITYLASLAADAAAREGIRVPPIEGVTGDAMAVEWSTAPLRPVDEL